MTVATVATPVLATAVVTVAWPLVCLVARDGPMTLPDVVPLGMTFVVGGLARRSLLAFRNRGSAAAWIEHQGRYLQPWPVLSERTFDRLALTALARYQCRWLALEPVFGEDRAETYLDFVRWLQGREPWPAELWTYGRKHRLGDPAHVLAAVR